MPDVTVVQRGGKFYIVHRETGKLAAPETYKDKLEAVARADELRQLQEEDTAIGKPIPKPGAKRRSVLR